MIITDSTKRALAHRRFVKQAELDGYECIGENGGKLWELYRGSRIKHKIVDARIDPSGMAVWVKVVPH